MVKIRKLFSGNKMLFILVILAIAAFCFIFKSNKDSIEYNLSIGYLSSLIFWVLVVYYPERQRKHILREHLTLKYKDFKLRIGRILIWASETADLITPEELLDHHEFIKIFKSLDDGNYWFDAINGIVGDSFKLSEILLEFILFEKEIGYVTQSIYIQDEKIHSRLKILSENIARLSHYLKNPEFNKSDDVKQLFGFLWSVFARFNFSSGQLENDVIQDFIDAI